MTKATRLTLLCRGRTASARLSGFSSDEPLLEREAGKAAGIARALRHIDRLLCAPEQSALETARAVGDSPVPNEAFRDLSYGRWQGQTLAHVAAADPEALGLWIADPHAAPHGGDSIRDLFGRVAAWMAGQLGAGGHTVVVTHPIVIKAMALSCLGAPLDAVWKLDLGFLTVTDLRNDGRRWAVRSLGTKASTHADD